MVRAPAHAPVQPRARPVATPDVTPAATPASMPPAAPERTELPARLGDAPAAHADPLAATLARAVQHRGPVLARLFLPTTDQFATDIAPFKSDKTLQQIGKRLKEWYKLDAYSDKHGRSESNDFKRISTAQLIQDDCERWLADHADDRANSSTGVAVGGLGTNAAREVKRLSGKAVKRWGDKADERLKKHITARDGRSGFELLAPVINAAVPTSGSKSEIEAELEFAVDPNMVGFVGARLKLEADRQEESKVKVRAELAFTAGAKFPNVGRVRFELGGYLEAQGRDANEVCQLISYGLYRTMRESHVVPRWFVNQMWGGNWDSDPGYANAERWAGKIETGVMGPSDAYVEFGALGGAMAEFGFQAGAVGAKAKVQIQMGGGERWDKKSVATISQEKSKWSDEKIAALVKFVVANPDADPQEAYPALATLGTNVSVAKLRQILKAVAKEKPSSQYYLTKVERIVREASPTRTRAKLGEASKEEVLFGAQDARGERTFWMKGSAEADISIASMAMKYEYAYQSRGRDKVIPTHLREFKIEGKFGIKLPLQKALGTELLTALGIEKAIAAIVDCARTSKTVLAEDKVAQKDKVSRTAGSGVRVLGDIGSGLSQLPAVGSEAFTWGGKAKSAIEPGVYGSVTLGVVIDLKVKPGHSDGSKLSYELNLQVYEEKAFKFEADLAVVSGRIGIKAQDRWLRIQWKDGARAVDIAGWVFEKKKK